MERQYYVYELIDPRNNKPFYVGKGHGTRMYAHLYEAKRPKEKQNNRLKCERINAILSAGYDVVYNVVSRNLSEDQSFSLETSLMQQYGFLIDGTGILTNIRKNDVHHKHVPERKHKSYSIKQYTLEGQYLCTFPSAHAVAVALNKRNVTSILNCCHGKRQTAYGYVWTFSDRKFKPPTKEIEYHLQRRKLVIQTDLNGNFIQQYSSIREAALKTGVHLSCIWACCHGRTKSIAGYLWQFKN